MKNSSDKKKLGFLGVSKIVSDAIIETLLESNYDFQMMDSIEKEDLKSFSGIVIADLTQFENNFEKIKNQLESLNTNTRLILIHSYEQVPVNEKKSNLVDWIHTDKVLDELLPALKNPNTSRYYYAV